jgi:hypothetical protein
MSELIQENMTITHDGRDWIAWNDQFRVAAPSLEKLDEAVRQWYMARDDIAKTKKIEVFMAFDNSAIPHWIRPFANHYFNRILKIN